MTSGFQLTQIIHIIEHTLQLYKVNIQYISRNLFVQIELKQLNILDCSVFHSFVWSLWFSRKMIEIDLFKHQFGENWKPINCIDMLMLTYLLRSLVKNSFCSWPHGAALRSSCHLGHHCAASDTWGATAPLLTPGAPLHRSWPTWLTVGCG